MLKTAGNRSNISSKAFLEFLIQRDLGKISLDTKNCRHHHHLLHHRLVDFKNLNSPQEGLGIM